MRSSDRRINTVAVLAGALVSIAAAPAGAQSSRWALCPAEPPTLEITPHVGPPEITAAELDSNAEGIIELRGKVVLLDAGRQVEAERMRIDRAAGRVRAEGQVRYATEDYELSGGTADIDMQSDELALMPARYRIPALHAQGGASHAAQEADALVVLKDASYSTCPVDAEAWAIRASTIELDQKEEIGTAYNIRVDLFGVPVLWSPWFNFPIGEKRKSGFLIPSLGQTSRNGVEVVIPWYWNIAPQMDATIVARNMTRRGLQLQNEVRYLNRQGDWQLNAEILNDDEQTDSDREYWRIRHNGKLGHYWRTNIDAAGASDPDYFDDLGAGLSDTAISHLRRSGSLSYADGLSSARIMAESWQTLDQTIAPNSRPYRRLPQITYSLRPAPAPSGLQYSLDAELVEFDREDSDIGRRIDLTPRVSWALGGPAWFFKPGLALRYTEYDLDRVSNGEEQLQRSLPLASIDAGLFFERRVGGGESTYLQTLEPRLYYLRVPFEDQDEVPLFDTAQLDFGFSSLFRENRFSGADRVGDANQLTLALTTRLLDDDDGREVMSASLGQIQYFDDRRVGLNATSEIDTRPRSDLVAEVGATPWENWRFTGQLQYDPETELNSRGALQVQYQRDNSHIANLGYRYRRADEERRLEGQEQVDLSARWALGSRWHLLARWNYSLLDEEIIESLAGVEYESCCWVFRLISREYLVGSQVDDSIDVDRAIYTQLVLKGFSDIGRNLGSLLEDGIIGYRNDPE